jgi:hypothetical protein
MRRQRIRSLTYLCALALTTCGQAAFQKREPQPIEAPRAAPAEFKVLLGFDVGGGGGEYIFRTTVRFNGIVTRSTPNFAESSHFDRNGVYRPSVPIVVTCRARPKEVDRLWESLLDLQFQSAPQQCPPTDEQQVADAGSEWVEVHTKNTQVNLLDCTEIGTAGLRLVSDFFSYVCPASTKPGGSASPNPPGDDVPLWSPPK